MTDPMDIEQRARELIEAAPTMGYPFSAGNPVLKPVAERIAIQLARETADSIAKECDSLRQKLCEDARDVPEDAYARGNRHGVEWAAEVARRHSRPRAPAPETNAAKYPDLWRYLDEWARDNPAQPIPRQWTALKEALGCGA